jgi:hypothetical protein
MFNQEEDVMNKNMAWIRPDLLSSNMSVPVGEVYYGGKEPVYYRWTNETSEFEGIYEVYYKNVWLPAQSVDWVFEKPTTALKEVQARQTEARHQAETKKDDDMGIHQCEICYTRGVGENDLNLICDKCQDALPSLLKSVGELEPLRQVFQIYQDVKENSKATGDSEWWLNKFVEEVGKLLE